MKALEVGEHLVVDPRICHGKLTFKGTRVPVQTVLTLLSKQRRSVSYVQKSWPYLKREAIEEAVRLAVVAWPELLQAEAGQVLYELAASMKRGKGARAAYEPVHSGRAT